MDDMIEDTFSKEEIELLDETIDFFKDYKSYQMMTLFRSTIKCENDIKALFTNLTKWIRLIELLLNMMCSEVLKKMLVLIFLCYIIITEVRNERNLKWKNT